MSKELMVIIVIAIVASAVIRLARIAKGTDRLGHRRHGTQALLEPAGPSPRELELQREVEDLRTRIHVLERIATDGRGARALADEIESLRGQ